MKLYVIGPSETDNIEFEALSYADAMEQARRTFGALTPLIVFAVVDCEVCV